MKHIKWTSGRRCDIMFFWLQVTEMNLSKKDGVGRIPGKS